MKTLYGPPRETLVELLRSDRFSNFASPCRVWLGLLTGIAVRQIAGWLHSVAEVTARVFSNLRFNLALPQSP